jgi:hypothetical protein
MKTRAVTQAQQLQTGVDMHMTNAKTQGVASAQQLSQGVDTQTTAMKTKAVANTQQLGTGIVAHINTAKAQAVSAAQSMASGVDTQISQMSSKATTSVSQMASQSTARLNAFKSAAVSAATSTASAYTSSMSSMASQVDGIVSSMVSTAGSIMQSLVGIASAAGSAAGAAFAAGIASQVGAVAAAAAALQAAAAGSLKGHSPPPDCPWADYEAWGKDSGQRFATGLAASKDAVTRAAQQLQTAAGVVLRGGVTIHATGPGHALAGTHHHHHHYNQASGLGGAANAAMWDFHHPGAGGGPGSQVSPQHVFERLHKEVRQVMQMFNHLPGEVFKTAAAPTIQDFKNKLEEAGRKYADAVHATNTKFHHQIGEIYKKHAKNEGEQLTKARQAHEASLKKERETYARSVNSIEQLMKNFTNLDLSAQKLASDLSTMVTNRIDALGFALMEGSKHLKHFENQAARAVMAQNRLTLAIDKATEITDLKAKDWSGAVTAMTDIVNIKLNNAVAKVALDLLDHSGNLQKDTAALFKAAVASQNLASAQAEAQAMVSATTNGLQGLATIVNRQATAREFTWLSNLNRAEGHPMVIAIPPKDSKSPPPHPTVVSHQKKMETDSAATRKASEAMQKRLDSVERSIERIGNKQHTDSLKNWRELLGIHNIEKALERDIQNDFGHHSATRQGM